MEVLGEGRVGIEICFTEVRYNYLTAITTGRPIPNRALEASALICGPSPAVRNGRPPPPLGEALYRADQIAPSSRSALISSHE
jgi:hypothetical protein